MKSSRRRFEPAEYADRRRKVLVAMARQGVDTLIITDPSNLCWLTGFDGWSFYVHQCVVLDANGGLFWFGRGIDAPTARLTTDLSEADIVTYADHYVQSTECHPMQPLAEVLAERGLAASQIGVEMDNYYFSAKAMAVLREELPNAVFVDATGLVNWQRAIKSPRELEYLFAAGRIIEKVYEHVMAIAEPGMRKNELAAEILGTSVAGTADHFGDYAAIVPLLGAGDEAAACHLTWDGAPIAADSGLFLELAGVHARYHCPCSRTLYFGTPPDHYRDIERVIQEGIENTLPWFRPGVTCGEVAARFFDTLAANGYEKDNRCGYSIGLSYPPDWGERTMSLRRGDPTELEEGMCFHFMPGMWFDDWGFELTESVTVTASGGRCLSEVPRRLLVK